jgi:hypothetical protein
MGLPYRPVADADRQAAEMDPIRQFLFTAQARL